MLSPSLSCLGRWSAQLNSDICCAAVVSDHVWVAAKDGSLTIRNAQNGNVLHIVLQGKHQLSQAFFHVTAILPLAFGWAVPMVEFGCMMLQHSR